MVIGLSKSPNLGYWQNRLNVMTCVGPHLSWGKPGDEFETQSRCPRSFILSPPRELAMVLAPGRRGGESEAPRQEGCPVAAVSMSAYPFHPKVQDPDRPKNADDLQPEISPTPVLIHRPFHSTP